MDNINYEIGKKIKNFRKSRNMTVENLGKLINKSKSTVSKYESGEIVIDIITLYNIANALNIHVEQLLYIKPEIENYASKLEPSTFFKNSTRFYSYFYDGRSNEVVKCVIDVFLEQGTATFKTVLYMNIDSYENYENCENTYLGYMEHYDVITTIVLRNQATPVERIIINILASFMDSEKKWGLMAGVSFRPFMPISLKMLFSKNPLVESKELINELKISKEDIRLMKIYNMFSVT